jgi:hypothetical protein
MTIVAEYPSSVLEENCKLENNAGKRMRWNADTTEAPSQVRPSRQIYAEVKVVVSIRSGVRKS